MTNKPKQKQKKETTFFLLKTEHIKLFNSQTI